MAENAEKVTIILPLPPRILSPNRPPASRGGRIGRAQATKKQRKQAREAIEEAGITTGPWEMTVLKAVFCHKTNRRRDNTNSLGMLKGAVDGVVDAGLMVDDDHQHFRSDTPEYRIDKEFPRVELTFIREE